MWDRLKQFVNPPNDKVKGFEIGDFIVARPDWGEPYVGTIKTMIKHPEQIIFKQPNGKLMMADTTCFDIKVLKTEEEIAYAMLRY